MAYADVRDGDGEAKASAAEWLERAQAERAAALQARRAREELSKGGEIDGSFRSDDSSKPWTAVHQNLPSSTATAAERSGFASKDRSRQREVIRRLREREAQGMKTPSSSPPKLSRPGGTQPGPAGLSPEPNLGPDAILQSTEILSTDLQDLCTGGPKASDDFDAFAGVGGEGHGGSAEEQGALPEEPEDPACDQDPEGWLAASEPVPPLAVPETDGVPEESDYESLMRELKAKREELSVLLQQQDPALQAADQSKPAANTLYQAAKPSHVKLLKGDLYSSMTPDELDLEKERLQCAIADLEKRTLQAAQNSPAPSPSAASY